MTLDELYDEWAIALDNWNTTHPATTDARPNSPDFYAKLCDLVVRYGPVDQRFKGPSARTYTAAKVYCIARDNGIRAAIMWKLSA